MGSYLVRALNRQGRAEAATPAEGERSGDGGAAGA